jgi:hypothetical protein
MVASWLRRCAAATSYGQLVAAARLFLSDTSMAHVQPASPTTLGL